MMINKKKKKKKPHTHTFEKLNEQTFDLPKVKAAFFANPNI